MYPNKKNIILGVVLVLKLNFTDTESDSVEYYYLGTVLHELLHTLGAAHEHIRYIVV